MEFLREDEPEKAEDRIENVQELSSMLQRYEQEAGEEASLSGFFGGRSPCSPTLTITIMTRIPWC